MNKLKIKEYVINALCIMLFAVLLWVIISGLVQRFKCPSMTETQLFLRIPQSFVCDWQDWLYEKNTF